MCRIKILIVEDDKDWLDAIADFLKKEEDFEIVGCAVSREEAVKVLSLQSVEVILLDINLNGNRLDGIDAIEDFRKTSKAEIIMVTSMEDREIILDSIQAGAVNYILKGDFPVLPSVIRNVKRNRSPLQILSHEYLSLMHETRLSALSVSERVIFDLISAGYSNSQIEMKLNKSNNTVRNQISSVLKKLGAKNCREIIKRFGSNHH